MTEKNDIDILLEYNKEYLSVVTSDEYKLGQSLKQVISDFKKFKLSAIYSEYKRRNISLKIRKKSTKKFVDCKKYREKTKDRVAIYKVVFGRYDDHFEPKYVDPQCDYFIITDQDIPSDSVWKKIPEDRIKSTSALSSIDRNRFYKMHPFEVFSDYKYSMYIDGNIDICGPVSDLMVYINPKTGAALHNMSNRDSIYDEIYACKLLKKGMIDKLDSQVARYKKEGFPEHFGMYECPIIMRENTNVNNHIMEQWWEEFLQSARRDQISLPYIIWREGLVFEDIGFLGNDVRNNPYFRQYTHR